MNIETQAFDEGHRQGEEAMLERVLFRLDEQLTSYWQTINQPRAQTRTAEREQKDWRIKWLALNDFKITLNQLFKSFVEIPE